MKGGDKFSWQVKVLSFSRFPLRKGTSLERGFICENRQCQKGIQELQSMALRLPKDSCIHGIPTTISLVSYCVCAITLL